VKNLKMLAGVGSIALITLAGPAMSATVLVTNSDNSGPGSFRAAVDKANVDRDVNSIRFRTSLGKIDLSNTVEYMGDQALTIDGRDTVIQANRPGSFDLFISSGEGDLTLRRLTFRDGANGIMVAVPVEAAGEVSVSLVEVTVRDNAEFGLLVDDLGGSGASVGLDVSSSSFLRNGTSGTDFDAIRVNEAGDGDIIGNINHSAFRGNGGDGVEFDEVGIGDVTLTARHNALDNNGFQDPQDPEDGLDIDEADEGGIWLQAVETTFNSNGDDGIGLDEADDEEGPAGDVHLSLVQVEASRNGDSGVSVDEGAAGDLDANFNLVLADRNGDDGADLEETGAGDFNGRAVRSSFSEEADDGISVVQEAPGAGILRLQDVTLEGNGGEPVSADPIEIEVIMVSST
jgi:hypothetical protein